MRPLLILCCLLSSLATVESLVDRAALEPGQAVPLLVAASRELAATVSFERIRVLADALDPLSRRIYLGGWHVPQRGDAGFAIRTLVAGDTISRIAAHAGTPSDLLVRLNPGIDPRRLRVGQRMTVLDASSTPLRTVAYLRIHRLLVWRGPLLVMACPIGIGTRATPTPTGSTTLAKRVKNPEWRDPTTGKVHPPGSPGNRLGGYWLGFDPGPDKRFRSIGCHGWTGEDPEQWLDQASSLGCLRLRQTDIADLYDLLIPGTAIEIR